MPNSIDLVRYRRFDKSHLLLERITSSEATASPTPGPSVTKAGPDRPFSQWLAETSPEMRALYERLKQEIKSQGDDVSDKTTKLYTAFKRTRNFATLTYANSTTLNLYLHLNPDDVVMHDGLRDVRSIGHWRTGDLEAKIKSQTDIDKVLPLIQRAYVGQI